MRRQVEVRDLEMIQAVVGQGTLSAAARQVGLSQPALSRQLSGLERRLGVALFLRVGRGLQLTASGNRLLEAARNVLPELARAEDELSGRPGPEVPAVPIRIVATLGEAFSWLPGALARHAAQSGLRGFSLEPVPQPNACSAVSAGEELLAIGPGFGKAPGVERVVLFRDEICAFASPLHPAAKQAFLPLSSLQTLDLLQAQPDAALPALHHALQAHRITPRRLTVVGSLEGALELAAFGYGVLCAARRVVDASPRADRVRRIRLSPRGLPQGWEAAFAAGRAAAWRSRAQELAAHCQP